jgi:hypothetical protein
MNVKPFRLVRLAGAGRARPTARIIQTPMTKQAFFGQDRGDKTLLARWGGHGHG